MSDQEQEELALPAQSGLEPAEVGSAPAEVGSAPAEVGSSAAEVGFSDAVNELEEILRRIEGEEIDLDRLATELKRATALLEVCRGKVRRAEIEVRQIVDTIAEADGDGEGDEAG